MKHVKYNEKEEKQDIVIKHSKFYEFLNKSLLILHILLVIFTIITLFGAIIELQHQVEIALESITLVIIFVIIFVSTFEPFIKRTFIKRILGEFWGEHKIETKLMRPVTFKLDENSIFGRITEVDTYIQDEIIKIRWKKRRFKFKRLWMTVKLKNESNLTFEYDFVINYIIVDIADSRIILNARLKNNATNELERKPFILNFHPKKQRARWSGLLPGHPNYGEWIWNSLDKNDDENDNPLTGSEFDEDKNPIIT